MYVGNQHSATLTIKTVLPFTCVHCAKNARAVVIGIGRGGANSPYFLDESGAKQRAASAAETNAKANADLTIRLARCPDCGRRNEGAVRAEQTKVALGVLLSLVLMPLIGVLLDHLKRANFGLYIFVPCAIFSAFFIWATQKYKWTTVEQRVAFLDEPR